MYPCLLYVSGDMEGRVGPHPYTDASISWLVLLSVFCLTGGTAWFPCLLDQRVLGVPGV